MNMVLEFMRSRDLLHIQLELFNLNPDYTSSPPALRRVDPGLAYIVCRLPPQHIAEELAFENAPPPRLPYEAFAACPSRIAAIVPNGTDVIEFSLDGVLRSLDFVSDDGTGPAGPWHIEFPGQILLTPSERCRFSKPYPCPQGNVAWVPIWHLRLDTAAGPLRFRAVRNPRDRERFVAPAKSTLSQVQRSDIATYCERTGNAVVVDRFVATTLGATATLKGEWREDTSLQLAKWSQMTTAGRDQYVEVTDRGYLFPFGHRASRITISERRVTSGIAGIVSRQTVVIDEFERRYDGDAAAGYDHGGLEMPFKAIRIAPEEGFTPDFDGRFEVKATGIDWRLNEANFSVAVYFVPLSESNNEPVLYDKEQRFNRDNSVQLDGQIIAIAESGGDGDRGADTEVIVERLEFKVARPPLNGTIQPPYLPLVKSALISLPTVESYLGNAKGALSSASRGLATMNYHQTYLKFAFSADRNPKQVYAELTGTLGGLTLPAERAGGLAAPRFKPIDGLSRTAGAVAGIHDVIIKATELVGDAQLLGTVKLASLIEDVAAVKDGVSPAEFAEIYSKVDALPDGKSIAQPILANLQTDAGTETRFVWKPPIKKGVAVDNFGEGSGGSLRLVLKGCVRKTNATTSSFEVAGTLSNFKIHFAKILSLDFDKLAFLSKTGDKMSMDVSVRGVQFEDGLAFLKPILPLLQHSGLGAALKIEPEPEGIIVRFGTDIPSFPVGAFSCENIGVRSTISLPFVQGKPCSVRVGLSERSRPFLVSVAPFGGTGFFAIEVRTDSSMLIESAIEFGGVLSINLLGIVKGGIYAFVGIYVSVEVQRATTNTNITGFVHWGGYADILGIISLSIEFYVKLTYTDTQELEAEASLAIGVHILFFSKTFHFAVKQTVKDLTSVPSHIVSLSAPLPRAFASEEQWMNYCSAFA